jgi:limonene-1,2-epoxide hydrolase
MLKGLEKVEWVNLRQHVIGQVVINDRIDDFFPFPGSKIPRMQFRVAGYFLIEDNKIKVWRDFPYPGSKQILEPAPKA